MKTDRQFYQFLDTAIIHTKPFININLVHFSPAVSMAFEHFSISKGVAFFYHFIFGIYTTDKSINKYTYHHINVIGLFWGNWITVMSSSVLCNFFSFVLFLSFGEKVRTVLHCIALNKYASIMSFLKLIQIGRVSAYVHAYHTILAMENHSQQIIIHTYTFFSTIYYSIIWMQLWRCELHITIPPEVDFVSQLYSQCVFKTE